MLIGDDPGDLEALRRVGRVIPDADAVPRVPNAARYVTPLRGAVREVYELILSSQSNGVGQ